MPGRRTRDAIHASRTIEPEFAARCAVVWTNLLRNPDSGGTFTCRRLMDALGVGYDRVRPVVDQAVADGRLVRVSPRYGYTAPGLHTAALTLQDLLAHAVQAVDPEAQGQPGRRATDVIEPVEVLTRAQFAKARAAAGVAARALGGDLGLAGVGSDHFGWTPSPSGEPGRGTWNLVALVERASDEESRAEHERDGQAGTWHATLNDASRIAHAGGIRTLLNFAHTRGLIATTVRLGARYGVHAAELQPWVEEAGRKVAEQATSDTTRYAAHCGARTLALMLTRLGCDDPTRADWQRVQEVVDDAELAEMDRLSQTKATNARRTYRALVRLGFIDGPPWGQEDRVPTGLARDAAYTAAAARGDFSGWRVERKGRMVVPTALIRGPYSITDWYRHLDARNTDAQLVNWGLPERAYLDPDRQQAAKEIKARNKGQPLWTNGPATLERKVRRVNSIAGWADQAGRVDFTTAGLETLVRPAVFQAYALAWQEAHPRAKQRSGRAPWLSQVAATLSTLASPYLERRALQQGNGPLAAEMRQASLDLFKLALTHRPAPQDVTSGAAKVAAWEPVPDGPDGIDLKRAMRDVMVRDIERLGGGSIAEQIAAVRAGTYRPKQRRALALLGRDAAIFSAQLRVPLRAENVCDLQISGPSRSWLVGRGCELWAGGIYYDFEASQMKALQAFKATLITQADALTDDARADLRPDLLELFFMPGGWRDIILTDGAGQVAPSPYAFPGLVHHGTAPHRAARRARNWGLTPKALLVIYKTRIKAYARRVGLDPRPLLETFGASTAHVDRALGYTAAARAGQAASGAELLAHGSGTGTANANYLGRLRANPDEIRRARRRGATAAAADSTAADSTAVPSPPVAPGSPALARAAARGPNGVQDAAAAKVLLLRDALESLRTGQLTQHGFEALVQSLEVGS